MFGGFNFLAFLFVIFVLPETKGKTNFDMTTYYMERARKNNK